MRNPSPMGPERHRVYSQGQPNFEAIATSEMGALEFLRTVAREQDAVTRELSKVGLADVYVIPPSDSNETPDIDLGPNPKIKR